MKRTATKFGFLILAGAALAGCSGGVGEVLGFEKEGPDEFTVVKRAPLSLPPNFALRPPKPGENQLNRVTPRNTAKDALIGQNLTPRQTERVAQQKIAAGQSPSEVALLTQAKALNANPNIRTIVNDESAALAEESQGFVDDLVFWRDEPEPGAIVDAREEARRLQENASLGIPVTEGETPTIATEQEQPLFEWPF